MRHVKLVIGCVLGVLGVVDVARGQGSPITVVAGAPQGKSLFSPGTNISDNQLVPGAWNPGGVTNDPNAVARAQALVAGAASWQSIPLQAWGAGDPWPTPPNTPTVGQNLDPTNWQIVDSHMQEAVAMGATPVLTLCEAPWWMKGQLQLDGTTALIPDSNGEWTPHTYATAVTDFRGHSYAAGYVSPDPYGSRILDDQISNWLHLVDCAVRRYAIAPYNVRYFAVWNEFKGYWDPKAHAWDYDLRPGDSTGDNAQHGYTFFYNAVYKQIRATFTALGLDPGAALVGGPYAPITTYSTAAAAAANDATPSTDPLLTGKTYGVYDDGVISAVRYWIANKAGAGYVTVDGGNGSRDAGAHATDSAQFEANDMFADVTRWLHTLEPGLPMIWHEIYPYPTGGILTNPQKSTAFMADASMKLVAAGCTSAFQWLAVGDDATGTALPLGIATQTTAGGGLATPWYAIAAELKTNFGPGTTILETSVSDPARLSVLASPTRILLVNKTSAPIEVSLGAGATTTLAAYGVVAKDFSPLATNLVFESQQLASSPWECVGSTIPVVNQTAPDGSATAAFLQEDTESGQHAVMQNVTLVPGQAYVLSAYIKGSGPRAQLIANNATDGNVGDGQFNPATGTRDWGSLPMTNAGNGWFRCAVTFVPRAAANGIWIKMVTSSAWSYPGDGTSGLSLWGVQLEQGTSPTAYVATTNAPLNLLCQSQQLQLAPWQTLGATATGNAATAPDGTTTATYLCESVANMEHLLSQTVLLQPHQTYTLSVYVNSATRKLQIVPWNANDGNMAWGLCDPATGGVELGTNAFVAVGGGWYRFSATFTPTVAQSEIQLKIYGPSWSYLGDGVSGLNLWGAQLELGPVPTGYAPTASSPSR